MTIRNVIDIGHSYMILQEDGYGFMQRKEPDTTGSRQMQHYEEILCAMCVRVIELQELPTKDSI